MGIITKVIKNNYFVGSLFLLWAGLYSWYFGVILSPDSHTYIRWADALISSKFNYVDFIANNSFVVPIYLYTGFISLVAFTKQIFGDYFINAIIIINIICYSLLGVGIYQIVKRKTDNVISLVYFIAVYFACFDILLWTRYLLSDVVYVSLVFVLFFSLIKYYENKESLVWGLLVLSITAVCLFFRPTAIVLLPIVLLSLAFIRYPVLLSKKYVIAVSLFILYLGFTVWQSYYMANPNSWPISFGKEYIQNIAADRYGQGVVINSRPETYIMVSGSIIDYALVSWKKFFSFFQYISQGFSLYHNLFKFFYYTVVYAFGVLAVMVTFKKQTENRYEFSEMVTVLSLVFVMGIAMFHSLTYIDYDWRYRVPILPYVLILSVYGFDVAINKYNSWKLGRHAK